MAAFLFAGPLAAGYGVGLGALLLAGAILALGAALFSGIPNTVSHVQETTVAVLASAMLAMVASTGGGREETVATALAIMGASSIVTGVAMWLAGQFKLGSFVRFLPYPVIAGFLAGSGWLVVVGAAVVVTSVPVGSGVVAAVTDPAALPQVLPAIMFAVLMFVALERFPNPFTMVGVLALGAVCFFGILAWSDLSLDEARALGHLPEMTVEVQLELPTPAMLGSINWHAVLLSGPLLLVIAGLNLVGFVLNLSGAEVAIDRDVNVNAELRSTGLANVLAGGVGGASGYLGLSMTILAERTGATRRLVGITLAVVLLAALVFGGTLVFQVPVFLTAGFLLYLGIGLLNDWLVRTWHQLPRSEWAIIAVILLVIAALGFMEGIAVGLVLSTILFVIKYAQLPIVRRHGSGLQWRSTIDRAPVQRQHLAQHGAQITIMQLQGYLFFGTADRLVAQVRDCLHQQGENPVRYVLLDFERVNGVDSAAISSFVKMQRLIETLQADGRSVMIQFVHLSDDIARHMTLAGLTFDDAGPMRREPDFDRALEYAEDGLLADLEEGSREVGIEAFFTSAIGPDPRIPALVAHLEKRPMTAGEVLIEQGDWSRDVYFVGSGQISVQVMLDSGRTQRVRTMLAGAVVGEMALYRDQPRSASVVVDVPSDIYVLHEEKLDALAQSEPDLAIAFHTLLGSTLSEKLTMANSVMQLK